MKTKWASTLAVVVLLPIFIALGFWQLDRAKQKQALQKEYDDRVHDVPIRIEGRVLPVEALRFHKVVVRGKYDPAYEILLDNRVHKGRAGYHVLTPLRVAHSDIRVLINRGWVEGGAHRAVLPDTTAPEGFVEIQGLATVPLKGGYHLGPANVSGTKWSPVWQYLDLKAYQRQVPFPIHPVVVLLDPESQAGGFVREWQRLDAGIAVHQGYAFQWFSLAVALLGLYLFFNWRIGANAKSPSNMDQP